MRHGIVADAIQTWRECRAEFEDYRLAEYERASEATRGRMLNRRGIQAGIDSYDLFIGNRATAYAYASEELQRYWSERPRMTYAAFEAQWVATRDAER
jgi:hypothetical protein